MKKEEFNKKESLVILGKLTAFIFSALIIITSPFTLSYLSVDEYKNVIIEDKERITTRENSYYLIYTNKGVFKNEDSLLHWKFNSSDYQGKLKIGESYDIKANWFRVPFLSMYENILEAKHNKK